jgi:hypothetical protein
MPAPSFHVVILSASTNAAMNRCCKFLSATASNLTKWPRVSRRPARPVTSNPVAQPAREVQVLGGGKRLIGRCY